MSLNTIEYMRDMAEFCYKKEDLRTAVIVYRRILRKKTKDAELRSILFNDFCRSLVQKTHMHFWTTPMHKVPQLEESTNSDVALLFIEQYLRFHEALEPKHDRWLSYVEVNHLEHIHDPMALYFRMKIGNGYILDSWNYTTDHAMILERPRTTAFSSVDVLCYAFSAQDPQVTSMLREIPTLTLLRKTQVSWLAHMYPALLAKNRIQDIHMLEHHLPTLLDKHSVSYAHEGFALHKYGYVASAVKTYDLGWKRMILEGECVEDQAKIWTMHLLMHFPFFADEHIVLQWGDAYAYSPKDKSLTLPNMFKEHWKTHVFSLLQYCTAYYEHVANAHHDPTLSDSYCATKRQRAYYIRQQLHQLTTDTPNLDELTSTLDFSQFVHYLQHRVSAHQCLDMLDDSTPGM